jgi:hypothetical protein
MDSFDAINAEYYACSEPIADRLFAFVKANQKDIRLAAQE